MLKELQWFKERIGKRIYRDSWGCECDSCKKCIQNGFIILDDHHVDNLLSFQNDMAAEGNLLHYRDDK